MVLTIQGAMVLHCENDCRAAGVPLEGSTAPWGDSITNLCHVAANEPAKPPEAA